MVTMRLILLSLLLPSAVILAALENPRLTDLLDEHQANHNYRGLFGLPAPIDFYSTQCQAQCGGVGGFELEPFLNSCPKCPEKYSAAHCNHCCLDGASSLKIRWHGCPGEVRFASSDAYFRDCETDVGALPLAGSPEALRFVDCDCYDAIVHPEHAFPPVCPPPVGAFPMPNDADICTVDLCIVSADLNFSRPLPDVIGLVHESYSTTGSFTTYIDTTCCLQEGATSSYSLPIYPGHGKFPNTCVAEGFIDLEWEGKPRLPDDAIDHFDGYPPAESFWYEFIDGTSTGFWPLDESDGSLALFDPTFATCACKTCDGTTPSPTETKHVPVAHLPSLNSTQAPSLPHAITPTTSQPSGGIAPLPATLSPSLPRNPGPNLDTVSPVLLVTNTPQASVPSSHPISPLSPSHQGPDFDTDPSKSPIGRPFSPQATPSSVPGAPQGVSPETQSPPFPSSPRPDVDTQGPSAQGSRATVVSLPTQSPTFGNPDIQTAKPTSINTPTPQAGYPTTGSSTQPSHPAPEFETLAPSDSVSRAPVTNSPTTLAGSNFPIATPTVTPNTESPSFPSRPGPEFETTPSAVTTRNPTVDSPVTQPTSPILVPITTQEANPTTNPSFPSLSSPVLASPSGAPLAVPDTTVPSQPPSAPVRVPIPLPIFSTSDPTGDPTVSGSDATFEPIGPSPPRVTNFPTQSPIFENAAPTVEPTGTIPTLATNDPATPFGMPAPAPIPHPSTNGPSPSPTAIPTASPLPAKLPTAVPTAGPSGAPTEALSHLPTSAATETPIRHPTPDPTNHVGSPSGEPGQVPVTCQLSDFRLCAAFSLSRCLTSGTGGLPAGRDCLFNGNTARRGLREGQAMEKVPEHAMTRTVKELEDVIALIKDSPLGRAKLKELKDTVFGAGNIEARIASQDQHFLGALLGVVEELMIIVSDSKLLSELRFGLLLLYSP